MTLDLPANCRMLVLADKDEADGGLIWKILFAVGRDRWFFHAERRDSGSYAEAPDIRSVWAGITAGTLKGVIRFSVP